MNLEPCLHAHALLRVERPPLLWEAETDHAACLRLLDAMMAAGRARGNELSDLVLNAGNVVVVEDAADERFPAGEYVALTVTGAGDWRPEGVWWPQSTRTEGVLADLVGELRDAGVVFAYSRDGAGSGSITICLRRQVGSPTHRAFVDAFNRRDLEGLVGLLASDATAEVLGSGFGIETGSADIARLSFPHLLDAEAALTASLVGAEGESWILLRAQEGAGPVDTAVRLEEDGRRISRIEYVVAPHQPDRLQAIGHACGLPTVVEADS